MASSLPGATTTTQGRNLLAGGEGEMGTQGLRGEEEEKYGNSPELSHASSFAEKQNLVQSAGVKATVPFGKSDCYSCKAICMMFPLIPAMNFL